MIKRYSRKQLTDIWSEENKYKIWLDVEIAAAEAMEKLGQIPRGVASIVRKKAFFLTIDATPLGICPSFSIASAAAISTSNQILYLFSSDQMSVNCLREYLLIINYKYGGFK